MSNRHTAARLSISALIAILGLSMSMMTFAQSADSSFSSMSSSSESSGSSASSASLSQGVGTITIEQRNSSTRQEFGSWILQTQNQGDAQEGALESMTLPNIPAGSYTLFVDSPDGFSTSIRTYHGSTEINYVKRPQITVKVEPGKDLRIVIIYRLDRTGTVSIQSDPAGLEFTLRGPNELMETGTTPASFDDVPEGQFSLQFGTLEGCVTPPKMSQELVIDGRISFSVKLACKSADTLRDREGGKAEDFVVISIDGTDVLLRDVPQSAWFATYVFDGARKGVLLGYKDADGKPTGEFGPGNAVTVAELAKVAHRLVGIGEDAFTGKNPENVNALGQWFSPFIASAEQRGWTLYKDASVDPLRNATRAEVMITLLQVMNIPLEWQKGDLFSDVTVRTRYASAVETAARDGIIEGLKDEDGNSLHRFDPEGAINRAELSKILSKILETYSRGNASSQSSRKS